MRGMHGDWPLFMPHWRIRIRQSISSRRLTGCIRILVHGYCQKAQSARMTGTKTDSPDKFLELEQGVHAALETYANVHRGSGHNSIVSTHLYEQAREILLDYLGLDEK